MTPPDAADLKQAFPAFASVDASVVDFWLERAARIVDGSWPDGDYAFAMMLLAAHYMAEQGLGTSAGSELDAMIPVGLKSLRSGSLSFERADTASGAGVYGGTSYGRQFALLLRQVKGGPRVIAGPRGYLGDPPSFYARPVLG